MNNLPEYLVLDIENNNSNLYKRKAGHFLYDPIVAFALKNKKELKNVYLYPNELKELQIDEDVIVGWNIKHDLLFLWNIPGIFQFIHKGGRIWDCSFVEYLLSSFNEMYPSLRDVAVSKYNCKERIKYIDYLLFNKKDTIKDLSTKFENSSDPTIKWAIREEIKHTESHKQVSDLPKASVLKDVEQDVLDTEHIFLQQYEQCKRLNLLPLIETEMNTLLFLIEAEYNGFKIDKSVLDSNNKELDSKISWLEHDLYDLVYNYWDTNKLGIFKHKSTKCLKLLFFGGLIPIKTKEIVLDEKGLPLVTKTGKNKGVIKERVVIKEHYYNGLGLTPLKEWCTEKGNISVNEDMLQELKFLLENDLLNKNIKEI